MHLLWRWNRPSNAQGSSNLMHIGTMCHFRLLILLLIFENPISCTATETQDDTHLLSLCRQNPTWRDSPEISWEICTKVTGWTRRSHFWEGSTNQNIYSNGYMNEETEATLHQCVKDTLDQSSAYRDQSWDVLTEPIVAGMQPVMNEESQASTPLIVEIVSALNEYEVTAALAVGSCVHKHLEPRQFEVRSFGDINGGNECIYMAGFLQLLAPGVVAQLQTVTYLAWQTAGWNQTIIDESNPDDELTSSDRSHQEESNAMTQYPDPRLLGLRTTEILSYRNWKHLNTHSDLESVYTVVVALSDPDTSYDGGEFYIETEDKDVINFRPQRLSAVVFLSETPHGLKEITQGLRETFATELWIRDDVSFGATRPSFCHWTSNLRGFKEKGLLDGYDEDELTALEEECQGINNQTKYESTETQDETKLLSLCRQNPTWRDSPEISWEICTQVTGWTRRSRFWEGPTNQNIYSSGCMNEETEATLHQCVKDILDQSSEYREQSWDVLTEPMVAGLEPTTNEESQASTPLFVEIESALNEYEAHAALAVGSCVHKHLEPRQFEVRSFGDINGGNECIYMAGFLQLLAPGVVAQLQSVTYLAWQTAGWNQTITSENSRDEESASSDNSYHEEETTVMIQYPDPRLLGLRTTEILSYRNLKHLNTHRDLESVYTIVVALSDPDTSYDGGEFYIETADEGFSLRPRRLSAVVFLSETPHGLKEVTRGLRETFATELWIRDDVPFGSKRPSFCQWLSSLRGFKEKGLLDDYDDDDLTVSEEECGNLVNRTKYEHIPGNYDTATSEAHYDVDNSLYKDEVPGDSKEEPEL